MKKEEKNKIIISWIVWSILIVLLWIYFILNNKSDVNEKEEDTLDLILNEITEEIKESEDKHNLKTNNTETMEKFNQTAKPQNWDLVAVMKTTNWTMKIRLFREEVPSVVNNFIGLASKWYYKDIIFHRVIKDFMIQWWDPDGTGRGGESIYWAKFDDEFSANLSNIRGSISMANAGPDTNWSQFFINQRDNVNLDYDKQPLSSKHAVFGQVYEGIDNIDKIAKVKTLDWDKPEKDVKIISIEINEYQNGVLKPYSVDVDKIVEDYKKTKEVEAEAKKTKNIEKWDKISVNYTGKLEDWTIFDSSLNPGRAPLEFEVWAGQMIKGFDAGVVWMKIGEKKTLTLAPSDAYGEYDDNATQELSREQLKSFEDNGVELIPWAELPTMQWKFKIKEVAWDTIIVDLNHELAGKTLIFDVEIVDIK